jgi:hypothetical protein
MKSIPTPRSKRTLALIIAVQLALAISPSLAQLDETCRVTANGQTVNVGFGGEFFMPNIPRSRNLFRFYAICTANGKTRYGRSDFYQFTGASIPISEMDFVFQDEPFPTTESITAKPDREALADSLGQTTQIRVTATLSDGTKKDVSSRRQGTTYISSNPKIARVDDNGVVTAVGRGVAFITVNNEGATTVTSVAVAPGDPLTGVAGFVQLENGTLAEGAAVSVVDQIAAGTTRPDGSFIIPQVLTQGGPILVKASATIRDTSYIGFAVAPPLEPVGITDVDFITMYWNKIIWVGREDGLWHVNKNWHTGRTPGSNANAIIEVLSDITVSYSQSTGAINQLRCEENFLLLSGFFTCNGECEFNNDLTMTGGVIRGIGVTKVNRRFRWSGGNITGSSSNARGSLAISPAATMEIVGNATRDFTHRFDINNSGTIVWTGKGRIRGNNGSIINNLPGALFEIRDNVVYEYKADIQRGPRTTINNGGLLRKSDSTGVATLDILLRNATGGVVEVQAGTLQIIESNNTGGTFKAASGTKLSLVGVNHSFSNCTFQADSTAEIRLDNGGSSFTFADTNRGHIGGILQLSSGSISPGENGGTLDFSGTGVQWTGGAFNNAGNINNIGLFVITGQGIKDFTDRATISNSGTIIWAGKGRVRGNRASVLNNFPGALFDIRDNVFFEYKPDLNRGPRTTINNEGLLRKSDSTGTALLDVVLINSGTIEVQAGRLAFNDVYRQTNGTTFLNGGELECRREVLDVQGGRITGTGGIIANVVSAGEVSPGISAGELNISGAYTQTASGILNIEIGGLTAATEFDRLTVGGRATLAGTLNVSLANGFSPSLGNSFQIMTYGSRTGQFATVNLPPLDAGLRWRVDYNATNLTLVVEAGG